MFSFHHSIAWDSCKKQSESIAKTSVEKKAVYNHSDILKNSRKGEEITQVSCLAGFFVFSENERESAADEQVCVH